MVIKETHTILLIKAASLYVKKKKNSMEVCNHITMLKHTWFVIPWTTNNHTQTSLPPIFFLIYLVLIKFEGSLRTYLGNSYLEPAKVNASTTKPITFYRIYIFILFYFTFLIVTNGEVIVVSNHTSTLDYGLSER